MTTERSAGDRRDERHARSLLEQRVAATQRQIAVDEAREMWPVNVNAALQALAERVLAHEARIAQLEAGQG